MHRAAASGVLWACVPLRRSLGWSLSLPLRSGSRFSTQTAEPPGDERPVTAITTRTLQERKNRKTPISFLTAYDYTTAVLLDSAGVDGLLVGDSASNVMAGHATTLPITLDHMIYHAQCVVRGTRRALVIVDLPFGSYQGNSLEALNSAIRVMKETGASGIKLEGGEHVAEAVQRIVCSGIPVMGHLGLVPQSINKFGGYRVRAQSVEEADQLKKDALLLERAGCFAVVLEKIPYTLAKEVTASLKIPTIGIGAGPFCDGQILVTPDMLGLTKNFNPRFVRRYQDMATHIHKAVRQYITDVQGRAFPSLDESYK
eukprot:RCo048214